MRFRFKGLNEYVDMLDQISSVFAREYVIEAALQDGADVVADEQKKALEGLKVDNRPYVEGKRDSILQIQKTGLIKSFGITPVQQKRNLIDVKTGFDGYNALGQPNVMIARMLESGTSFMDKNPVISKATKRARNDCLNAMQDRITLEIDKIKARNKKGLF